MSEIKLSIEDKYLSTFLNFLSTLNYVSIKEIAENENKPNGKNAQEFFLKNLSPNDPMKQASQPMRSGVTAQDLIKEQGYKKTDWERLEQLAKEMDIQEPIEQLIEQLTP